MHKAPLIKCSCKSEFQDKEHGVDVRVSTPVDREQAKGFMVVRCTVCGKEHNLGAVKK